ncbi:MAG: PepSY domain-containing protein [Gemmatimonadales bacterium]|nr:PepSY domain-containing protein [Gemmatimonadales bacterium]
MKALFTSATLLASLAACAGAPKEEAAPAAAPAAAAPAEAPKPVLLSACVNAVAAAKPGAITELDGLDRGGKELYEFEVKGTDGKEWEVVCDPSTGTVVETEEEVKEAAFKGKAKVSRADAEKAAQAVAAGKVEEIDFEVEADGKLTYEIEIVSADGKRHEIEIDAESGQVVEHDMETYEIGDDGD